MIKAVLNKKEILAAAALIIFGSWFLHLAKAGTVSSFKDALSSQAVSTAANHTISFVISSEFGPNDTLEIFFENGFDLSAVDYTDIDLKADNENKNLAASPGLGVGSNIGVSKNNQTLIFTQNDTDSMALGTVIEILIGTHAVFQAVGDQQVYNPAVASVYLVSLSGTFGDFGSLAVQILDTDSVGFTGMIEPSMSVIFRNNDDTGPALGCTFGIISKSTLGQCLFRIGIDTNIPSGFQLYIASDGNLRNNNGDLIASVTENNAVTAGSESYGLALSAGTGIDEAGDFNDDDTPIPVENSLLISTNSVYNYIQGDLSTSSLVNLKLAVSETTSAGNYSQTIIYSLLANY